jgi:hypothetical protein
MVDLDDRLAAYSPSDGRPAADPERVRASFRRKRPEPEPEPVRDLRPEVHDRVVLLEAGTHR